MSETVDLTKENTSIVDIQRTVDFEEDVIYLKIVTDPWSLIRALISRSLIHDSDREEFYSTLENLRQDISEAIELFREYGEE